MGEEEDSLFYYHYYFILYFLCVLLACMSVPHVCSTHRSQKRESSHGTEVIDSFELPCGY